MGAGAGMGRVAVVSTGGARRVTVVRTGGARRSTARAGTARRATARAGTTAGAGAGAAGGAAAGAAAAAAAATGGLPELDDDQDDCGGDGCEDCDACEIHKQTTIYNTARKGANIQRSKMVPARKKAWGAPKEGQTLSNKQTKNPVPQQGEHPGDHALEHDHEHC